MGLFDLFSDALSGDVLGLGLDVLGLGNQPQPFQASYMPTYDFGPPMPAPMQPQAIPTAATMPLVARAVAAGLPAWSARFPALWQFLAKLPAGARPKIGELLRMLRKWGPTALAGYMGVAAVNDLMTYSSTHKRRRMNPANARALRRSMRRLKSFDRLSCRVSEQLRRVTRKKVCR